MLESIHGEIGCIKFKEQMEEKGERSKLDILENRYSAIKFIFHLRESLHWSYHL